MVATTTKKFNYARDLKFFYTNARSIIGFNKRAELQLFVFNEKPDVIGITESWAKEGIQDSELELDGYVMFRKDRENQKEKGHGAGGVLLYIKNDLSSVERKDFIDNRFRESIWCEVRYLNKSLLIGICYRVPNSSKESDIGLYELITKASTMKLVLMGDFNHHIDWIRMEGRRIEDELFLECIEENFLTQHVLEKTADKNILDLIISTEKDIVEDVKVGEKFGTSDHCIIRFKVVIEDEKNVRVYNKKYNYHKADYNNVRNNILGKTLVQRLRNLCLQDRWNEFVLCMKEVIEETVPIQRGSNKKHPWINKDVLKTRRARKRAWDKLQHILKNTQVTDAFNKNDELESRIKYVKLRNIAKESIRKAIKTYEEKLSYNIERNSKCFYNYMKSKQIKKVKVGPLKNFEGINTKDEEEAAEVLNKHFASVFTKENIEEIPEPKLIFKGEKLENIVITKYMVIDMLESLSEDKTSGIDDLHPKFLKEVRYEIGSSLSYMFNESLTTGIVPRDWKDAIVVPLFKKGNKSEASNYRPISLTCILCKLLERIIKNIIVSHLDNNNIINDSQHGFRKDRSCMTNLLDFFEVLYDNVDKGHSVDIIYLDFAKAFDKVPHKRLIKKLQACGIDGNILEWIKNWLNDRRQKVKVGNKCSDWINVESGVPQGSVLGPILFIIYINDIDVGIMSKISKFADDTKLCANVNNEEECNILRSDLKKLFQWSLDWQMSFNIDKCVIMHIGKRNKCFQYSMNDNILRTTKEERDLGVIVHESMKTSRQCVMAASKANKILGFIRRTIVSREKQVIINLYKTLVRPHLEYCVQVWSPYMKKDIDLLERVQRRATKIVKGIGKLDYEQRLQECGLTTLEKRRTRGDLIETFKLIKGRVPESRYFQLSKREGLRGNGFKIYKKPAQSSIKQGFFSNRVINIWNRLSHKVVSAETLGTFKIRLRESGY